MPAIKNLDELTKLREAALNQQKEAAVNTGRKILVGMGFCGIAAGAQAVFEAIQDTIKQEHIQGMEVAPTGCIGLCEQEPLVQVTVGGRLVATFGKVTPDSARSIVSKLAEKGEIDQNHLILMNPVRRF